MSILQKAKILSETGEISSPIQKINFNISDFSKKELNLLHDIMLSKYASLALDALYRAGFFDTTIPEIKESFNINTNKRYKKIWPHTLEVINQAPRDRNIRWAALFHDLGKVKTFEVIDDKVTFRNHERESANIFYRFSKDINIFKHHTRKYILSLIRNLELIENIDIDKASKSAIRRFIKRTEGSFYDLVKLSKADITTKNEIKRVNLYDKIDRLKALVNNISEKDTREKIKPKLPKGIGNVISEEFGIPLGEEIGRLKDLLDKDLQSGIIKRDQSIQYYIDCLKSKL